MSLTSFFHSAAVFLKESVKRKTVQIFLITLIIHVVAVILFSLAPAGFLANGSDDILYLDFGKQIATLLHQGMYHFGDVYSYQWYPFFLGGLFYLIGVSMTWGSLFNALLAAISAVLFYRILKESNVSEKVSFWGTLVVLSGYGSYLYHSSILIKEAWVVVLLLGMMYASIRLVQGKASRFLVFAGILIMFALLRSLRYFIGFAAMTGVMVQWFLNTYVPLRKKIIQGVVMMACVIVVAVSLYKVPVIGSLTMFDALHLGFIHDTRKILFQSGTSTTHIQVVTAVPKPSQPSGKSTVSTGATSTAGTTPSLDSEGTQYRLSIGGILQSFVNTAFGPFPWQFSIKKYIVLVPDMFLLYVGYIIMLAGIVKMKWMQVKTILPWLVTGFIIMGALVIGVDNLGTLIRHRITAFITLGLVVCYCIDHMLQLRAAKRRQETL